MKSNQTEYVLLNHCTETTALPNASKVWQSVFTDCGLTLKAKATGCCGMAGTYGHETQNLEKSKALYEMSWQKIVDDTPIDHLLATGFSCRSQVKRFNNGDKPKHPIQLLNSNYNHINTVFLDGIEGVAQFYYFCRHVAMPTKL